MSEAKKKKEPSPDELLLEGKDFLSEDNIIGFVSIKQLGNAQQVRVDTKRFAKIAKFLGSLSDMGFPVVIITVQNKKPVVFGGKITGIAIAPMFTDDEK